MSLTRKHYVALAEALHLEYPTHGEVFANHAEVVNVWQSCVDSIADTLATDNPRFDRERFIKAAQGDKETRSKEPCIESSVSTATAIPTAA